MCSNYERIFTTNGWFYSDRFVEHEENPSKNEFKQIGEVHLTWEKWCSWQLWACRFWCGWSLQPGDRTGFAIICLLQRSPKNKLLTIIFSPMIWVLNSVALHLIHRKKAGTLGMVPLIINPIYTLYNIVGIYWIYHLSKGSNRGG